MVAVVARRSTSIVRLDPWLTGDPSTKQNTVVSRPPSPVPGASTGRFLALSSAGLSFSSKLDVTNLDKLVGEFSTRFCPRSERHTSAADLEHSEIRVDLSVD